MLERSPWHCNRRRLSEQTHRDSQSVELVWTGPDTEQTPFRRTEQAILQVLDAAKTRITLVSFAVYRIPNVGKALVRAAKRGVRLTVIVETPDKIEGEGEYSTIQGIGAGSGGLLDGLLLAEGESPARRQQQGRHPARQVCRGRWRMAVPSSANLTQQAFTINMELGMLVRGGTMPDGLSSNFKL